MLYDEIDEESGKTIKNMIKITSEYVEVTKRGGISSKLCFQEEKSYQQFTVRCLVNSLWKSKTDAVMLDESDEVIEATVKYELFINGSSVSTNNIVIKVENKVK